MISISDCYRRRFDSKENETRGKLWKILCETFLQKFIQEDDAIMDIGAGYCEFLNNIKCKRKIAVDINPDTKKFAAKDIEVLRVQLGGIPQKFDKNIDVVFMSNFLEHLNSKDDILFVLSRVYRLLNKNGKVIIIQPNIDLVKEAYWDFIDHKVALNTKSLKEALDITGFKIDVFIERFLPYTTKRKYVPMRHLLLKLYLKLPTFIRPSVGESFIVATKKQTPKNSAALI